MKYPHNHNLDDGMITQHTNQPQEKNMRFTLH